MLCILIAHTSTLHSALIDQITKNRTSIVIAHRLATVKKADKIIVMDQGKIVEQGNHLELLKISNGYYKKLYEVQFNEVSS